MGIVCCVCLHSFGSLSDCYSIVAFASVMSNKFYFWPGLGLPRPKAIVVIPKNQPLPKHLRKKEEKCEARLPLRLKKTR